MNREIDSTGPSGSSSMQEEAMANENPTLVNGLREAKDLRIETYSKENDKDNRALLKLNSTRQSSVDKDVVSKKDSEQSSELISFMSGNPYVEETRGILHLYKENILSTVKSASEKCDTICILAIPATMICKDLVKFTSPCHEGIQHLRIIKDGTPNQYMALLTFRSPQMAGEFYKSFNGVPFNSIEPDCICHLAFVSGVEVEESHAHPPPNHTELPTCPVCLERMDESVDGILTILCEHSFHSNCLSKWGDTSCPICRYVQTPELVADNRCFQCFAAENLWICLICGHVGCSRYIEGHAFKHYVATQHCYSMQLGSNRVWDYAGDNFVHRLLQNKGDGKLVEGEQPSKEPGMDEKIDSMQLEWTYNLIAQLEKQKEFFEEKISRITDETAEIRQKLVKATDDNKQLQASLNELYHEKSILEKKNATLHSKLLSALSQLQDEKEMSKALQRNQTDWQTKFTDLESKFKNFQESKDKELTDLKEQLRDIMFFLEAQKIIEGSDAKEEIAEGQIVVGDPAPQPESSNVGKHRRRRHR